MLLYIQVTLLAKQDFDGWFTAQPTSVQRWFKASGHDSHKVRFAGVT
jgi:hypothetical protein